MLTGRERPGGEMELQGNEERSMLAAERFEAFDEIERFRSEMFWTVHPSGVW